jgi:starvation-inducible DNA-binding protein
MKKLSDSTKKKARKLQSAPIATPSDMSAKATRDISAALNPVLADVFALYLKTKNFHWHVSGPHFRDYHLLLDEQAAELFAMTDPIAERVRKIGGQTLRSIGHVARACSTTMPTTWSRRTCWPSCARTTRPDHAAARGARPVRRIPRRHHRQPDRKLDRRSERRTWFLFETTRRPDASGH